MLDQLDDRFHEGIIQTKALMAVYQYQQYPPDLLVNEDLIDTILKHIPDDQQDSLENNNIDSPMTINKFQHPHGRNNCFNGNSNKKSSLQQRNRTKICQICGGVGHDGLTDGCDMMCKNINISNFLSSDKKATPKVLQSLQEKFKERNKNRIQRIKQNMRISSLNLDSHLEDKIMNAMMIPSDVEDDNTDSGPSDNE